MLFNSFEFLFLFLPVLAVVFFFLAKGNSRYWILIFASLLFYSQSGREHAYALVASVLWVYIFVDRKPVPLPNTLNLAIAILGPTSALIY